MSNTDIVGTAAVLISFLFVWFVASATEKASAEESQTSICIYEVGMIDGSSFVGWTPAPCRGLDLRVEADHAALNHTKAEVRCDDWAALALPGSPTPTFVGFCDPGRPVEEGLH